MKILVVTNVYPTASDPTQGTFVEQQVKGLQRSGVDTQIVHVDRRGEGMRVYMNIASRVGTALREYDPDVVHCMYGGMLADVTTRTCGEKPVIVSYCGSDLFGNEAGSLLRRRIIGRYRVYASHRAARRATAIIVVSEGLGRALSADIDRRKIHLLPHGVDMQRFQPLDRQECRKRIGWEDDRFHILFTNGRGDPHKRIELARSAVERLRQLGVPAELNPIPCVSHADVPIWLNAADVVILTSIHEGSPNAIKEALACNRPIVSVDVGDVRERIEGVKGCYLVDANPDAIAEGLRGVYAGQRTVLGRNTMSDLSLEAVSDRLIRIYKSLLGQSVAVAPEGRAVSRLI